MIGALIEFKLEIDNICRQKTAVAQAIKNTESESPKKKWAARSELVTKTTEYYAELMVLKDKIYNLIEQTPYNTFIRQLNAGSAKTQHLRANNQQPVGFDAVPSVSHNDRAAGRREQTEPPAELSAALPSAVTQKQHSKQNGSVSTAPPESTDSYTIQQKNEALALVRLGGNGPAAISDKLCVSRSTAQSIYSACRRDIALEIKNKNAIDARAKKAVSWHETTAAGASKRSTAPTPSAGQAQLNADDVGASSYTTKKQKLDQGKHDLRNRIASTMLEVAIEFAEAENAQSAKPPAPPTLKAPKQLKRTGDQQRRPASADSGSAAYAANLLLSLAAESTAVAQPHVAVQNYNDELESGNAADEESAERLELASGKKKSSAVTFGIEPLKGILKKADRAGRY